MIRYKVTLTKEEREELLLITKGGVHNSKRVIHSMILLNCDEGKFFKKVSNKQIAKVLNIRDRTVERIKKKFVEQGLEAALKNSNGTTRVYDKKTDGELEAHLIALSCSKPPKGFCRWSLRLLADKMVEMRYIESISHETVRNMLKKTN